ncbi:MAG TPA: transposase [Rickettsia endosymbiont of Bembidion lapponicum]|nr:transposase [Rickettsia endosymbiont of Bembidion lapponicum]
MGSLAHHWEQQGIEKERARSAIKLESKLKKEKITIAKKMLSIKEPMNKIIDFTGLTEKEIKKLK